MGSSIHIQSRLSKDYLKLDCSFCTYQTIIDILCNQKNIQCTLVYFKWMDTNSKDIIMSISHPRNTLGSNFDHMICNQICLYMIYRGIHNQGIVLLKYQQIIHLDKILRICQFFNAKINQNSYTLYRNFMYQCINYNHHCTRHIQISHY